MPDSGKHEERYRKAMEERQKLEEEIATLDTKISRLRVLYDQYFMGIEKLEPLQLRSEVQKMLLKSKIPWCRNTAIKFRFRGLQQKFTSYVGYWDRIVRLIEEGKIRRGIPGHAESGTFRSRTIAGKDEFTLYSPPEPLAAKRRRFRRRVVSDSLQQQPEQANEQSGLVKADDTPNAADLHPPAQAHPTPTTGQPEQQPENRQLHPHVAQPRAQKPTIKEYSPTEIDALHEHLRAVGTQIGDKAAQNISKERLKKSIHGVLSRLPGVKIAFRVVVKKNKATLVAVKKKQGANH